MSARAWTLFASVSVIWGVPYLLIKISVDGGFPPVTLAWARMVVGGAVLLALAARSGSFAGVREHWRALLAYATVELSIPFPMIALGERHIPSSLAAIIISTVPLLVALLALRVDRSQKPTRTSLGGLMAGLVGVGLLVGVEASGKSSTLLAVGGVFIAAVGYAGGPLIYNRHLTELDRRAAMGTTLWMAALLLTPVALLDWPARTPTAGALAAMLALALLCTAVAFVLMASLILEIGPARAVVVTYINPVIALVLGVIFLDESPGLGSVAGLALILAGSWAATQRRTAPQAPSPLGDAGTDTCGPGARPQYEIQGPAQ
ncbi:MAG: DMT family transporter [Solirubrobacteraceae bacterium]